MNTNRCYLNSLGMLCAIGATPKEVKSTLLTGKPNLTLTDQYYQGYPVPLGLYTGELPDIPMPDAKWQTRNNQFALAALSQIEAEVNRAIQIYGKNRVGVIIGSSTSSIAESEDAIRHWKSTSKLPESFDYSFQEMGATAQFIAEYLGTVGPAYGISTACSSGAKTLASAKRLIRAGLCDAVIAGGVDTLCSLTVQGFSSLEAVSNEICLPFSKNRKGINIGEGGALFLVTREPYGVELSGVGESSDAHHISAPDPSGTGAVRSMRAALHCAQISPQQVGYLNLHGTATQLNDHMEATAVNEVFGEHLLCSSTKPFTGHTLGAAGAIEAGICWLSLSADNPAFLPVHLWDNEYDSTLPKINLVSSLDTAVDQLNYVLSNSFAFGGNNISLLLGKIK